MFLLIPAFNAILCPEEKCFKEGRSCQGEGLVHLGVRSQDPCWIAAAEEKLLRPALPYVFIFQCKGEKRTYYQMMHFFIFFMASNAIAGFFKPLKA